MSYDTDQIIVTGAAGWLGRRLIDVLVNGLPDHERLNVPADVRNCAMVLPSEPASALEDHAGRVEVIPGDLRNAADCARLCANARGALLLHTAGVIHPRRVRDLYAINVRGTENLLQAAVESGVRRAVVVSSNSPCGCNPLREHRFDEDSPYNPYLHYGRSKMQMELAVAAMQATGRLETVVIRPPWFYGPFQPPRQTLFFQMIRDGKAPIVGDGNNLRSMAYIDNLVQGMLLAARAPSANGRTYWIADESPYTMNEIVDTVERLLQEEFNIRCVRNRIRLPGFVGTTATALDKGLQALGLYNQKIHVFGEMNKTIACRIDRARCELGYEPKVGLEEGMRRSIRHIYHELANAS